MSSQPGWSCPRCTLYNSFRAHRCQACGGRRRQHRPGGFGLSALRGLVDLLACDGLVGGTLAVLGACTGAVAGIYAVSRASKGASIRSASLGAVAGAVISYEAFQLSVRFLQQQLRRRQRRRRPHPPPPSQQQQQQQQDDLLQWGDGSVADGLEQQVPDEQLQRLLAAAMQLPTVGGSRHSPQHRMALVELLLQMHQEHEEEAAAAAGHAPGTATNTTAAAGTSPAAGAAAAGGEMSLPLVLAHHLVGEFEYEELYDFFGPSRSPAVGGVPEGSLSSLPLKTVSAADFRAGGGVGAKACTACPICLEEYGDGHRVRQLPCCGYAFHCACVDRWLRMRGDCPLCRASVACAVGISPGLSAAAGGSGSGGGRSGGSGGAGAVAS